MSSVSKTEAIKIFLHKFAPEQSKDLAALYTPDMECQVMVAQDGGTKVEGEYKDRKWNGWTDGLTTWKDFRIPWNAWKNPHYEDSAMLFDLARYVLAIGLTGWDWKNKVSKWVAFDFDAIVGHSEQHDKRLTGEELQRVRDAASNLSYVTVRKSTSGRGLHLYVPLLDVPTANHTEHAALAKAILAKMSKDAGYDFTGSVDACGGVMWIYHRKQKGTDGLTLLKKGEVLQDVPANWRDFLKPKQKPSKKDSPSFSRGEVLEGGRNSKLTSIAGSMRRRGASEEEILAALILKNQSICKPPLELGELATIANSVSRYDPCPAALDFEGYPLNDIGNGQRFAAIHKDSIRFCPELGDWLTWDGKHWSKEHGAVERLAKSEALQFRKKSEEAQDELMKQALFKHYKYTARGEKWREMIKQAETELGVAIELKHLDCNPMLLNVENGTIDLKTGVLTEHRREDYITKLCKVKYDPTAICPMWLKFLDKIMGQQADLIEFMQRAIGLSLTGLASERVLFILHGGGNNGKSTLVETFSHLLGEDYAVSIQTETLMARRPGSMSNDIARLQGKRFGTCSEVEQGQKLAQAMLKQLTGNEKMTARKLYKEPIEFLPELKIWLSTNLRPEITGNDRAMWKRVKLIPFDVTITDAERNVNLQQDLRTELPGILAWGVAGCLKWMKDGLKEPPQVIAAVKEYRDEMNSVQGFVNEYCEVGVEKHVLKGALVAAYRKFTGIHISEKELYAELRKMGFEEKRFNGIRGFAGFSLINEN